MKNMPRISAGLRTDFNPGESRLACALNDCLGQRLHVGGMGWIPKTWPESLGRGAGSPRREEAGTASPDELPC